MIFLSGEGRGGGNLVTIGEGRQTGRHTDSIVNAKSAPFYNARNKEETVELMQIKDKIAERAKIKSKKVKLPETKPIIINIGGSYDDSEVLKGYAAFTKERDFRALQLINDVIYGAKCEFAFENACKKLVSYVMYFPEEFFKNKKQIADDANLTHGSDVATAKRDSYMEFMFRKYREFATPLEIHVHEPKQKDELAPVTPKSDHPHLKVFDGYKMKLTFYDLVKLAKEVAAAQKTYNDVVKKVPAY